MALCELPARCTTPTSVLGCYFSFLSDSGLGLGDEPLPLLQPLDSSANTGAGVSNGPQAEPRQVRVKRPRSPSSTTWKRANERFKELTAQAKLARDTYQTMQRANAMLKTRLRVLDKAILTCDEQVGILERYQCLHRLHSSSSSSGAPGSPPPSALSHSTVSAVKAAQAHNPWLPSLSAALGSHSSTAGPLEEPHGGLLPPQPAAGAAASILARPVSEPGQGGAAAAPSLASGAAGELHMLQQLASLPASQLFPFGREVLEQLSSCLLAGSQPGAQLQLARVTRSMSWATSCMCMLNPLQYHLMAGLNVGHAFTSGATTDALQATGCSAQARAGGGRQPGAWGRRTQVVAEHQGGGRLRGTQAQAHCSKGGPALHCGGVAAVAGLAAGPLSCSSRDSRVEAGLLAAPSQPSTCAPSTAAAGGCLEARSSLCGGGWEWEARQAGQQRSQRLWARLQAERDALYQQGLPLHMSAQALPACRLEPGQMAELHEALGLFIRMMKRVRSQREVLLLQHWQLTEAVRLAGPGACSSLAAWALMDRLDANLQQEGRAISTLCFLVWGRILKASQLAEVMMATMPYVPSLPALLGEVLMGWQGP